VARPPIDNLEPEGDFALGLGIAIGMFIALFAVGIALFVIEQGRSYAAPVRQGATAGTSSGAATAATIAEERSRRSR
jgi:UPF0716 family protein affecting phage T7 exclusion